MSSKLQNSIWPNAGGTLGQIKVQIPDGVTTPWPTGDALVGNFVFNKGKLVGFVDTKALIANSSKTTTFPYDYVNISLPSIAEGEMTYNYDQCAYFILNGKVIKGDIPTNDDLEEINFKYMGCKTVANIKAADPNYLTNDIIDGVWTEGLGDLEQGTDGSSIGGMFYYCAKLTTFTSDLSSLTDGSCMFYYCSNLTSFNADLSSLTNGYAMFASCPLTSFSSNLSSLTEGERMFCNCGHITSFNADLSSLTNGYEMFYGCTALNSFSSDLPSLTEGDNMFMNCSNLESFSSDLSSLTNGYSMFYYCFNLTSFNADLSSLTNGHYMFLNCKLDTASVQNIANTINTVTGWHQINIGIGNSYPNGQEEAAFNTMVSKGWTVYVNGSQFDSSDGYSCCASCAPCCDSYSSCASCCAPSCAACCATCCASLTTLDETDGEFVAPKPYWAKPVPSDEQNARYVDSEGNFYNILGAQFIYGDNLETYGMFTSLEDAQAQMRLKKIGEIEIETA